MRTPRTGAREHEPIHLAGVVECDVLGDHPAHRRTQHMGPLNAQSIDDSGGVGSQLRHRVRARAWTRTADAAVVHHRRPQSARDEVSDERVEDDTGGPQSRNEEDELTRTAVDADGQRHTVGRSRHELGRHRMLSVDCRSVPRLFVAADQVQAGRAAVVGADAAHLARSLRVRPGELVLVVDDTGVEHALRVDVVSDERVEGAVEWSRPVSSEVGPRVRVLQALLQGGIDECVDTLTQVGVYAIHPFVAERSVARPDAQRAARRLERWRTIAHEAAQQAFRALVPEVHEATTLAGALDRLPANCLVLVALVDADQHIAALDIDQGRDVAVVIGPEGGLTQSEVHMLESRSAKAIQLGSSVLRSRLAGTIAVALLLASAHRAQVSRAARP